MDKTKRTKRELIQELQELQKRLDELERKRNDLSLEEETLRKVREELEERVEKRESALSKSCEIIKQKISEGKRTEEALEESERRYQTLFESVPIGLAVTNFAGKVLDCNDILLEMIGYSREDLDHVNVLEAYYNPGDREMVLNKLRRAGSLRGLEIKLRRKDGAPFYGHVSSAVLPSSTEGLLLTAVSDISERKRVEKALQSSEKDLRKLSRQILTAQEEERKRIARELHDGIGQSLSAIKVRVELALREIGEEKLSKGMESLSPVVSIVQEAIDEVRRIAMNLRPRALDDLGILATLSWMCREMEATRTGLHIERRVEIRENDIPEFLKTVIYRVSQEALNNIVKHSRADFVSFSLRRSDGLLELAIEDNGSGFKGEDIAFGEGSASGLGLKSMKERTELSGGIFSVESEKGAGTVVRASWPPEALGSA